MQIAIRPAGDADRPFIAHMLLAISFPYGIEVDFDDAFDFPHYFAWLQGSIHGKVLIAENDNGRSVGMVTWQSFKLTEEVPGWLDEGIPVIMLAVRDDVHNQGIGKILLEQGLQAARQQGLTALSTQVHRRNLAALKLAVKHDFIVAHTADDVLVLYCVL
jgi:GNAT superfamily N-acetyltransferase